METKEQLIESIVKDFRNFVEKNLSNELCNTSQVKFVTFGCNSRVSKMYRGAEHERHTTIECLVVSEEKDT